MKASDVTDAAVHAALDAIRARLRTQSGIWVPMALKALERPAPVLVDAVREAIAAAVATMPRR